MASVTNHYGISGPVEFADVDVHEDNLIFVDPHRIRLRGPSSPHGTTAVECLDSFLDTIKAASLTSDPCVQRNAKSLLTSFNEPWETRLGMSRSGFRGHGGAEEIGLRIWTAMETDLQALMSVGVLKHLEELPLFVHGVDRDVTSDITTCIVLKALIEFTHEMTRTHIELRRDTVRVEERLWQPAIRAWASRQITLPSVDGEALILVPEDWTGKHILMHARRYYDTSLLSHVQMQTAVRQEDGRLLTETKDSLRRHPNLQRGRETNRAVTLAALRDGSDLVGEFRSFVDARYEQPAA